MKTYFKFQYFLLASLLFSSLLSCDSETAVEPLDFPEVDYTILPVASEELAFRSNPLYNSHGEDFKYLTLFDDAKKSGIAIKITTKDPTLLHALTSETVKLYLTDKLGYNESKPEAANTFKLEDRSGLQDVVIEVIEVHLAKWVKFYGIEFARPELLPGSNAYKFTFKNHSVKAVYVTGRVKASDAFRINCASSLCADCNVQYLAPTFSLLDRAIKFTNKVKSNFELSLNNRFSDRIIILW
ncbi:MAG: hypothetical protein IPK91_05330 [Saprospiraceae bacterium]|jgi:hypothetical protein|nr:hypothetical protein [Saprospiraceae bacterium]MBK8296695.1 hypothetical protein [Saprospiraceae bacterium]